MATQVETLTARVQLFSNPNSGSYNRFRLDDLSERLRSGGAVVDQHHSANGPPSIAPDATHVCVSGGDGTVRHVAMAILRTGLDIPLAIHPTGTINLLARESGFSLDHGDLSDRMLRADTGRKFYPVEVGDTLFLACASAGPDSHAVARLSPRLKRRIGRLAYVAAFLHVLVDWPRPKMTLRFADRKLACEAFFIAKGKYYAGPWSLVPEARTEDRIMHVISLARARRSDFALFMWDVLRGRDPALREGVTCTPCLEMEVRSDAPVPLQADGDIIGQVPTHFKVSERALRVC